MCDLLLLEFSINNLDPHILGSTYILPSSDADPCTYTICKATTDICKIRIDFDTMVLAGPYSTTAANAALTSGGQYGKCKIDTLQVNFQSFTGHSILWP